MQPRERLNVTQLLKHPFITGDYEHTIIKQTEFDFKRFYSEDIQSRYLSF
jgi:hypothetical protein